MPDLIYNVKFEIDKASAEKVGQIVDTSNTQDVKVLQKEVDQLNQVLKESSVENGKVSKSVKQKILAYKEEVANLKLLDTKINKSIRVYGEFSQETNTLVTGLQRQSEAVDRTGGELLELANASDRTTGEIVALTNAVSTGNRAMVAGANRAREFSHSQGVMQAQMGSGIKTFAAGNQMVFSFSDLIQDSTQFSYGFATGMRAIGNNISFTAELFAYLSREAKAANQTLRQSLMASLKGVNGAVLALNLAVTVGTILLEKFRKKSKETADDLDEANEAGDRFLQTTDALIKALQEVNVLTSPEAVKKRRLEELDAQITRLQLIEQQKVEEEKRLKTQLEQVKTSEVALRIQRMEGSTLLERQKLDNDIFEIQQKINKLDTGREERAEEINALQKEQMELGTQIRIDTDATAKAEAEALDILTKRRQEGQAQVDLLKEGRDLPTVRVAAELVLGKIGEDEFGKDIFGDVLSPDNIPELDLNQARVEANKAMFDAMFENADAYAQAQKALNTDIANTEINTRRMVLSTLSSLAGAFAQENKGIALTLLAIEKGLAIADVIVDGTKRASMAANAAAFFSANPLTAALGASYEASVGVIKANTAATVAAIAAQGIGQAASISRAGGGGGGGAASGGTRSIGVGANTRFLPTAQQSEEESFRAFGESVNFTPNSPSFKLSENIIVEQNVKGKDLALVVRAGNKELKSSQVIG